MTFLEVKVPLRTDDSFRARSDGEYHKGHCLLEFLPIYIIKDVPIYYMHAVLGPGAMGCLLKFWVRSKQSTKIPLAKCYAVNIDLNSLTDYFPSDLELNKINYFNLYRIL